MEAKFMTVTPEMAERWLEDEHRHRNRLVSGDHVKRIAEEIRRGDWKVNGETIILDKDGRLLDGQHRLKAISLAGLAVESLVVSGIDGAAMPSLGRNRKRSAADTLTIEGFADTNNLSAAITQLIVYREYNTFVSKRVNRWPSPREVMDVLEVEPEIADSLRKAHTLKGKLKGQPVSTLAVLHYLFEEKDSKANDQFWSRFRTGTELEEGDPILVLRERLFTAAAAQHRFERDEFAGIIIKAWNAWRAGESVQRLIFRSNGPNPERMPDIK